MCKRHVSNGPSIAPMPIEHHASPQAFWSGAPGPPAQSSTKPKTHGLMAPTPKPNTDRTENAKPIWPGGTVSLNTVENTDESPIEVKL